MTMTKNTKSSLVRRMKTSQIFKILDRCLGGTGVRVTYSKYPSGYFD